MWLASFYILYKQNFEWEQYLYKLHVKCRIVYWMILYESLKLQLEEFVKHCCTFILHALNTKHEGSTDIVLILTNTIVLIIFQVNNKIVSLQRCILHLVKLRFSAEWFHKKFRHIYLTNVCASGLTNWICSKLWKMTTDYCQLRSF